MTQPNARWVHIDDLQVGAEAVFTQLITDSLVHATADVTGDWNPLHVDAEAARTFGHSRPVAHGVILMGLISRMIGTTLPGPGSIWFAHEIEFLSPVYSGDTVEIRARISHVSKSTNAVILELSARSLPGTPVLRGTAKVRIPNSVASPEVSVTPSDTVAIVTGASRGVGRAIAVALAETGVRVCINFRSDRTGADATVAAVQSAGGTASLAPGDLATEAGAQSCYGAAMSSFGRVDLIVHNATPPIEARALLDATVEDYRTFFDVYVGGLHELVRLAAPQMKDRKYGKVIAILTSYITEVPVKYSAYIAGKQALAGYCRSLAVELGPSGIVVNTVTPSILIGPRTDEIGVAGREMLARRTPLRRIGDANDVARAVVFLAGNASNFISGANIAVTGGILI